MNYNYVNYRKYLPKSDLSFEELLEVYQVKQSKGKSYFDNKSPEELQQDDSFMASFDQWLQVDGRRPYIEPEEVFQLFLKKNLRLVNQIQGESDGKNYIEFMADYWIEQDKFVTPSDLKNRNLFIDFLRKFLRQFDKIEP